jgi:hypothetical protein
MHKTLQEFNFSCNGVLLGEKKLQSGGFTMNKVQPPDWQCEPETTNEETTGSE